MKTFSFGVVTLCALLATLGCASAPNVAMSASTPANVAMSLANGRASELRIGAAEAYWIWRDADNVWHLRTTARKAGRHFQGIIRPLPGAMIEGLTPVGLAPDAQLGMLGRAVTFKFRTKSGMDGFDFQVTGKDCVEFDLLVDGDGDPAHIYVGQTRHRPGDAHFMLCP